jgi:hypothetical protein
MTKQVNILGTGQGHPHEKEQLEELENYLSLHLKHHYKRSIGNLDLQLVKLFQCFEDILATSDLDIGLFNGEITHRIDT